MQPYRDSKWRANVGIFTKAVHFSKQGHSTHSLKGASIELADTAGSSNGTVGLIAGGIAPHGYPSNAAYTVSDKFESHAVRPLPRPRFAHAIAAELSSGFYVVGGVSLASDRSLELDKDILHWSAETDRWEVIAQLPLRAARLVAEVIENHLVVIAGDTGTNTVAERPMAPAICRSDVQILDLKSGTWTSGAPKPIPESGVTSAVKDGEIYVCSSVDPKGAITVYLEVYDLKGDQWRRLPDMPTPRTNVPCGFVGDELLVVNGLGRGLRPLSLVEVYDTVKNAWASVPEAPPALHAGATLQLARDKFAIVGGFSQ